MPNTPYSMFGELEWDRLPIIEVDWCVNLMEESPQSH